MKAIINSNEVSENQISQNNAFANAETDEVKVIEYREVPDKNQIVFSLHSALFSQNQIQVLIRENKLMILITEQVESGKTAGVYFSDWQSFYQQYTPGFEMLVLCCREIIFIC